MVRECARPASMQMERAAEWESAALVACTRGMGPAWRGAFQQASAGL